MKVCFSDCTTLVGGSQKGGFGKCSLDPENQNEGTKNETTVPKTGTRVQKRNDGTENRYEGTFAKTTCLQNHPFVSSRSQEGDKMARVNRHERTHHGGVFSALLGTRQMRCRGSQRNEFLPTGA